MSLFDLFRKDKGEGQVNRPKAGLADAEKDAGARADEALAAEAQGGIEVEEAASGLAPELEEAAVLYANGKVGDAAALINRYLLDNPDNRDPRPWYMLFDLYEISGQKEPFEDAAVDFAVKFGRSPPTWAPRTQADHKDTHSIPYLGFGASFGPADQKRLERFLQSAADKEAVRVDVSRTPAPDANYARVILDCLVKLQQKGKAIELIGGDNLIGHLEKQRLEEVLTEPGWLLLLTLLQLTGQEARFEDVAIDYAMRFEVSPPSYTAPKVPKEDGTPSMHDPTPSGPSFAMHGVVGASGDTQIEQLRAFAADKPEVEVDLSQVIRIDFASSGPLLDTLISLKESGHKIVFKEGNELVNALLNLIGAGEYAVILGRKRV